MAPARGRLGALSERDAELIGLARRPVQRWRLTIAIMLLALGLTAPGDVLACGVESDCPIGQRSYRIALPTQSATGMEAGERIGAILFLHGYRGKAARTVRNKELRAAADTLGVALIAPQSALDDWSIPNAPAQNRRPEIDEGAFMLAVLDDAARRFPIDRDRVMASGFSAGGMAVWELACRRGAAFIGFAPIAGTFWKSHPPTCPSAPVDLIHFHGESDTVVPLAGRPIADTRQGDVRAAFAFFLKRGGFEPVGVATVGKARCDSHKNDAGKIMQLCLHPGGHSFSRAYVQHAWMAFTGAQP